MRFLFFILFAQCCLAGEWSLRESRVLGGSGNNLVCVRKVLENGTTLYLVKFDGRSYGMKVLETARPSVAVALAANGCIAGVNGGYFHPGGAPLGLLAAGGRLLHPLERSRLLSGLVLYSKGRWRVLRVGEFSGKDSFESALQAGPFLVDQGKLVSGLNVSKRAARTVLLSDGANALGLLVCYSPTLDQMGRILLDKEVISEMPVRRALNLDGGSSTALWVQALGISKPEFKPVSNALGIYPR